MNQQVIALFTTLILITACSPSTEEDALITFYEEDTETADEITASTESSDESEAVADEDEGEEDETENESTESTDSEAEQTSSIDCTSYSDFEDRMLCQHNYIRAYGTDPEPATALESLTWSTDLEDVARGHAEACVYEHNAERSDTISGYVGENIAAATWEAGAIYVVNMWAAEVEYYDYETNSCDDGEQCGHYTQIVWSDTTEVGCAVSYCSSLENTGWSNGGYFYVCNYSPGGNYVGQQPYSVE
ncbi:CAP domain-containing protein [Reinekea marinisedimentorum]|uniref:Cysteine-rich secretory protein family protein n=1 Tax=Reinekea marinisedimentorum TaxID=230495 RepID=A0A4R3IAU3_9GAMM|nr:CAP domain-containing protein [Reinekea marinisedimentorum]TCS42647.1 Cysteine-rich secretory protein family protein [Reinekea marinisedimentorum]